MEHDENMENFSGEFGLSTSWIKMLGWYLGLA
jgi:hypothetical protein